MAHMTATDLKLGAATGSANATESRGVQTYDAIVIGAGAAGGLASLLLAEANLNVLTLDAGWQPPLARAPYRRSIAAAVPRLAALRDWSHLPPLAAQLGHKALKLAGRVRQPVQSKNFAWALAPQSFVDDRDFPYELETDARFDWFRAHQVGGRMTIPGHGRQYHRLSEHALTSSDARWPLTLGELEPWYEQVEQRVGVRCQQTHEAATDTETETLRALNSLWPGAVASRGRSAPPLASIDLAERTGHLHLKRGAVTRHIDVDASGRVAGVTWVDRASREVHSARAPIVFACASAFETTRILLSSRSAQSPNGIGASSGALGHFVMDHITMSAEGEGGALPNVEDLVPGRCVFVEGMPVDGGALHGIQIYRWSKGAGRSNFNAVSFAEMSPRSENRVVLNNDVKDACGNPTLRIECRHNEADVAIAAEQSKAIREVADALGVRLTRHDTRPPPPGTAMHECGGARMGSSPETSVLDANNECWEAKGLYVTDGAAFPTQGIQHPTLTIMAMTARACAHAVRMLPLAAATLMNSQFLAPLGA